MSVTNSLSSLPSVPGALRGNRDLPPLVPQGNDNSKIKGAFQHSNSDRISLAPIENQNRETTIAAYKSAKAKFGEGLSFTRGQRPEMGSGASTPRVESFPDLMKVSAVLSGKISQRSEKAVLPSLDRQTRTLNAMSERKASSSSPDTV